jgi:hypothetical protein
MPAPPGDLIQFDCSHQHQHEHFQPEISRNDVVAGSALLQDHLAGHQPQYIVFDRFKRGYGCLIVDTLVRVWHAQATEPVAFLETLLETLPKDLDTLEQLARALHDFGCDTGPFERFALDIIGAFWESHRQDGTSALAWAFIFFVFGFKHEFGVAVLDAPELCQGPDRRPSQASDIAIIGHIYARDALHRISRPEVPWNYIRAPVPYPADLTALRRILRT